MEVSSAAGERSRPRRRRPSLFMGRSLVLLLLLLLGLVGLLSLPYSAAASVPSDDDDHQALDPAFSAGVNANATAMNVAPASPPQVDGLPIIPSSHGAGSGLLKRRPGRAFLELVLLGLCLKLP